MNKKTKLIATLMAMCMVITLGVIGIFAVKTLNMSVGGNIVFNAEGLAFTVSAGEFKTTSNAKYSNITSQSGKLQGFEMNTNTKLSDVQTQIDSWTGLELVATETLGDPVLHFTITNNMPDEILSINQTITLGTNTNDNMEITVSPAVANIEYGTPQTFAITFHIKDTTINAGLQGFEIAIDIGTALVVEENEIQNMTFTQTASNTYTISDCTNVTGDVVIPHYVTANNTTYPITEIASHAFANNTSITSITIPNTVTKIGNSAFSGCTSLTGDLIIPDSVTIIGDSAFSSCGGLTGDLVISNSVISIGSCAFSGCSGLTGVTIPASVTSIYGDAFSGCSGFESIVVDSGNANYYSSGNCIISKQDKVLIAGCNNSVIPRDEGIQAIGAYAFAGCDGLTSVTIPDSVTSIGIYVFPNCINLTSITVRAITPPTMDGSIFVGISSTCKIYVPAESVEAYKSATNWSGYADRIQAIPV